jgi:hypothetical protein
MQKYYEKNQLNLEFSFSKNDSIWISLIDFWGNFGSARLMIR